MDPSRYPPTMPSQMGDANAGYAQVMHHPQMAQQPHHMPMQMPSAPQQQPLPHQVNHSHAAQQPYSTPISQYASTENMQSNGDPATTSTSVAPSPRLPPSKYAELPSISQTDEATGRTYTLIVEQQPQRARMCGFGDKDRRPITPPPCVKLVVTDRNGKEVDVNSIDHSMFVLNVDLWSADGSREVNLVRHSSGTPSISSTTQASYGSLNSSTTAYTNILPSHRESSYPAPEMGGGYGQPVMQQQQQQQQQQYGMPQGYGQAPQPYAQPPQPGYQSPYNMQPPGYTPATQFFPNQGDYRPVGQLPSNAGMAYPPASPGYGDMTRVNNNQPQGMFTRNLIGSLAASAFRLTDNNDKIGIWFVLQDLSVRTEGHFRLRFSFVNVASSPNGNSSVNKGKSPVLASCFSNPLVVYSAKKFPGVCESTPLSKQFAHQGIKIPIRKEANSRDDNDD